MYFLDTAKNSLLLLLHLINCSRAYFIVNSCIIHLLHALSKTPDSNKSDRIIHQGWELSENFFFPSLSLSFSCLEIKFLLSKPFWRHLETNSSTSIYLHRHEFSSRGPKCTHKVATSAVPKRISKETNVEWGLEWGLEERGQRGGQQQLKMCCSRKGAADWLWILSRGKFCLFFFFFFWGVKKTSCVVSEGQMGLCSVTKLWAYTHAHTLPGSSSSWSAFKVNTRRFPSSLLLHTVPPFCALLMVPQGGRESLLFILLFLSGKERTLSQQDTDAGREWCWAETCRNFALLAAIAAERAHAPQILYSLQFLLFPSRQRQPCYDCSPEFKPVNPVKKNSAQKSDSRPHLHST